MDLSEESNVLGTSTKVVVLILMGLPGSGKTTLCISLPHFLGCEYHIIHLCYDHVIPFKEVYCKEERENAWKNERTKVVKATEMLLNVLIGARSSKGMCEKESSQYDYDIIPSIDCKTFDRDLKLEKTSGDFISGRNSAVNLITGKRDKTKQNNQDVDSNLSLGHIIMSNGGHYTRLDSFNDISSFSDKIKKCNLQNETFVLCVDDNCYYRSMRKEWWNLAAKYKLPFCTVMLKCDVELCLKRVKERFNTCELHSPIVPDTVIGRMDKLLELPDGNIYPWEKYSVVIDSDSFTICDGVLPNSFLSCMGITLDKFSFESLNRIRELIKTSMLEPAKLFNKEKQSNTILEGISLVHTVDLVLRKIVSASDARNRSQINTKRKNILEDLRNKKLVIPSDVVAELMEDSGTKFDEYLAMLITQHY